MLAAFAVDGLAHRHVDNARPLDKRLARPALGRGDRNRHHLRARHDGQARGTGFVLARLAPRNARALGEHDDPNALRQQALALLNHLVERAAAVLAVDMDHVKTANRPAEKRNLQQLFFKHIGQRHRHDGGHQKCLKRRLVLAQQHHALLAAHGQVIHTLGAHLDADDPARAIGRQLEPGTRHFVADAAAGAKQAQQQNRQGVRNHRQAHKEQVQYRANQGHGCIKIESAQAAAAQPAPTTAAAAGAGSNCTSASAKAGHGSNHNHIGCGMASSQRQPYPSSAIDAKQRGHR